MKTILRLVKSTTGKIHFKQFLYALCIMAAVSSCKKDDDEMMSNPSPENQTLFNEMQMAMGGEELISDALSITYESNGEAFEFQEDPEPINGKVADYTYSLLYNLDGSQSRQDWTVDAEYAYSVNFAFIETIDNTLGKSEGTTGTFSAHFGSFGVTGDPMFSTKIAARQKTLMMSSPIAMAKLIASNNVDGAQYGTINIGYNSSDLGFGSSTPDIQLVIDTDSKLPIKAQTLENDPLLGDALYEVIYSNWTDVNGILLPENLEHKLDGNTIRIETLTDQVVSSTLDESELTVSESEAWQYDVQQAKYGYLSSQFHYRTLLQTFPIDFPVEYVDQTSPLALASELVMNDDNVYRVSGDFQSHFTYAFKVDGELILYDTPINDRRSEAVLDKIRTDFSTAPIKYVVHSHNHFDHTGGVRGSLAEGGELIVGAGSESFIEGVLQRPSTVLPNPINGSSIEVLGLAESMTIGSGDEEIQLYTIETSHAENDDYIVIYKPSTQTLYFNDLYNPGFIFVFDTFDAESQERMIELAGDVVDFVDGEGLDVQTYHCSHGFTTQDFDFQTVRDLAGM